MCHCCTFMGISLVRRTALNEAFAGLFSKLDFNCNHIFFLLPMPERVHPIQGFSDHVDV